MFNKNTFYMYATLILFYERYQHHTYAFNKNHIVR
ncbi:MAG: hypothetical protein JWR61_3302 [Ferruginibacter sp.]|nr:hypothetical protein [Ferruginibacter sp.]